MNWNAKIFSYCERGNDPSFWAEPINALSNGAFIIAALAGFIYWLSRPTSGRGLGEFLFIILVFIIGVGSFLFHTYATRWAVVADTVPILLFMVFYFPHALYYFLGFGTSLSLFLTVVFYSFISVLGDMRCEGVRCLNGSLGYIPALIAMLGIGAILAFKRQPTSLYLLTSGLIFALSVWLRTIDREVCAWTAQIMGEPLGTHFLWHILNAIVLYLLIRGAIYSGCRSKSTT